MGAFDMMESISGIHEIGLPCPVHQPSAKYNELKADRWMLTALGKARL
jgi:hypothetical protein